MFRVVVQWFGGRAVTRAPTNHDGQTELPVVPKKESGLSVPSRPAMLCFNLIRGIPAIKSMSSGGLTHRSCSIRWAQYSCTWAKLVLLF